MPTSKPPSSSRTEYLKDRSRGSDPPPAPKHKGLDSHERKRLKLNPLLVADLRRPRPTQAQRMKKLDVDGDTIRPGDRVKSTPEFHDTDRHEGTVISAEEAGEMSLVANASNTIFVRVARKVDLNAAGLPGQFYIFASAAFLWKKLPPHPLDRLLK